MAGYILVDIKTKKIIGVCSIVALALFIIGILIGYFSTHHGHDETTQTETVAQAIRMSCNSNARSTPLGRTYFDRYLERHAKHTMCINSVAECSIFDLPRHYIAYHMNDKDIVVDGKLNEPAWKEVPWSENFVDMRSDLYPAPYLDTKFKIRWDNTNMYVGAYIQEKNMWATHKEQDSNIYTENGFEFLMDVDGSMFNYKQMQINVLGTMMDQILSLDEVKAGETDRSWHPDVRKEVYTEGTVNKPGDEDKFWTVEMALSFKALAERSKRQQHEPSENEAWFIQFGRSEQKLNVTKDGLKYQRVENSTTDWWSWQPCDTINLHIQDRWGLVQFKTDINDHVFNFKKWHIYKSLFKMFDAMVSYKAVNKKYTTQIEELDIPPYLLSRTCVDIPEIKLVKRGNYTDFDVSVKSMSLSHKTAHIRSDRYVWFE